MSNERRYTLRERIGALALDVPRCLPHLFRSGGWVKVCNRSDALEEAPDGPGVRCPGPWSSDIHVCGVWPRIAARLMRRALRDWPICLDPAPPMGGTPDVSFVIPHRGAERLPLLLATVRSALAQRDVAVECVVVEQSADPIVTGLPHGVRTIHLPHPTDSVSWRKAWAFNVGVEAARADIVVCHDGDVLAPRDYAREICRHIRDGECQVVHLQRFLFCLGDDATERTVAANDVCLEYPPERVRQNWKGGTLAIRKDAFRQIGGFDEDFVAWSGEDREFHDRCMTLEGRRYGYIPFVHLWHQPQASRVSSERKRNLAQSSEIMDAPRDERIERLRARRKDGD